MRRVVAILLVILFACSSIAYAAEAIDLSTYTYEELLTLEYMIAEEIGTRTEKVDTEDKKEKTNWRNGIAVHETISAGNSHTVAIREDGSLVSVGGNSYNQCEVTQWNDIVAISAGDQYYTVGLRSDGTVVAVGWNWHHECDVESWTDIVAIDVRFHTVGLKADGTVVAAGWNIRNECNVENWTDIVAVAAGGVHTIGLRSDGTVIAVGENDCGQLKVSSWTDIIAVAAGVYHTVGLKSDGTVVAKGENSNGQCNVGGWTDVVAIDANSSYTIGLKSDGTVLFAGRNESGMNKVSQWKDIIAISAGSNHIVGLKMDGTAVAVGSNRSEKCDISNWSNIATQAMIFSQTNPNLLIPDEENDHNINGINPDLKVAMDSYEKFMDEYIAFMVKYNKNPYDPILLADYVDYMLKYVEFVDNFEKWKDEELNNEELAYYIEVEYRVSKKLLQVLQ